MSVSLKVTQSLTLARFVTQGVIGLLLALIYSTTVHAETTDRYKKGMHVVITGTGAGWSAVTNGGAGAAVIIDGKVLQFDAGPKTQENLVRAGVLPKHKIDYLFFTHQHADHTTDFVYMRAWPFSVFNKGYQIFGPQSTKAMSDAAADFNALHYIEMDALAAKWSNSAGLALAAKELRFSPVKEIAPIGGIVLDTGDIKVTAAATTHMVSEHGYSFAYRVDSRYGSVVLSGDTVPSVDVVALAKDADLLVHEAGHAEGNEENVDTSRYVKLGESTEEFKTNNKITHSLATEVGKVAQRAKAKTLVTYHHLVTGASPYCETDSYYGKKDSIKEKRLIAAIRKNYDGEIVVGASCMVFEINKLQ